jgi:hypothetical protein
MKALQILSRHRFLFYALCFVPPAWSSLHRKAVGETILYSVAIVASLFLAALPVSIWSGKKAEKPAGQDEHREETTQ